MDDRLRVNDHVHTRHLDVEEPPSLDHLQALVEQRGRIDRDLSAHFPGRVLERLLDCHARQLLCRESTKRTTAGREDQPPHVLARMTFKTLVNRVVLAIDWQHLDAVFSGRRHYRLARHNENLLGSHGQVFARLDRRESRPQTRSTDDRNENHVSIWHGREFNEAFDSVGAARHHQLCIWELPACVPQGGLIRMRAHSNDLHPVRNVAGHLSRARAD